MQPFLIVCRARGIVRRADIDDVRLDALFGQGQKAVFGQRFRVHYLIPRDEVRVHIGGIDGIGDKRRYAAREYVQKVAKVAFGAVGDEDLVFIERRTLSRIIPRDRLAQEIIALLWSVAAETALCPHLIRRAFERAHDRLRQRQRHVADAERDDLFFGKARLEGGDARRHFGEKIVGRERLEIFTYPHFLFLLDNCRIRARMPRKAGADGWDAT